MSATPGVAERGGSGKIKKVVEAVKRIPEEIKSGTIKAKETTKNAYSKAREKWLARKHPSISQTRAENLPPKTALEKLAKTPAPSWNEVTKGMGNNTNVARQQAEAVSAPIPVNASGYDKNIPPVTDGKFTEVPGDQTPSESPPPTVITLDPLQPNPQPA